MTKIMAISYLAHGACSLYRTFGVLPFLPNVHLNKPEKVRWCEIIENDIIFHERPAEKNTVDFLRVAKSWNKPVWIDYDDDMLNLDKNHPAYKYYLDNRENVIDALMLADVVTVTTESIKEAYSEYNKNIIVIPNAYNDYSFPMKTDFNENSKVITWRGSKTHFNDMLEYANSIKEIGLEYPDWKFIFIGGDAKDQFGKMKNATFYNEVDPMKFFFLLHKSSPSIHIVPLEFNDFNRGKSNIAWLESTMAGACCLGPNMPEWNEVGCVTYENDTDFYNTLKVLINDENIRRENRRMSKLTIENKYLLSQVNKKRVEVMSYLLDGKI